MQIFLVDKNMILRPLDLFTFIGELVGVHFWTQQPRLPPGTNFGGCNAHFEFFIEAVSMTSEVKIDAIFGLRGPDYYYVQIFEAFDAILILEVILICNVPIV